MKKYAVWLLAALLLLISGCGKEEKHSQYLLAMDTIMELTVYGSLGEEGLELAAQKIKELESLLSVTDSTSLVYALNANGSLEETNPHLANLLNLAMELGARTDGALDVTIYPVVKAWGFTEEEYRVPRREELDALLEKVNWAAITWDGGEVCLPEGAQIDLGSIAKGYAGGTAAEVLRELGVTSALLNLGGNVQTVGDKPDGSGWRIAVKDPLAPESENHLGLLSLVDQAVVTSGGYERYFEQNGQAYWHIIDPATGQPARSGLISVTVVGADGAMCDGLSTALFIMGKERALEYWRTWGGFEAILVEEDGTVTVTPGLEENFELTNPAYTMTVAQ